MTVDRTARPPADITRALDTVRSAHVIVQVVANGVRGDSRVIKSAIASIDEGLPTLVLGITAGTDFEFFEVEGISVLLTPFNSDADNQTKTAWAKRMRAWRRREWDIALLRGARTVRGLRFATLRRPPLRTVARSSKTGWIHERRSLLNINVALADVLDQLQPRLIHVHDAHPLPAAVAHAARQRIRYRRVVDVIYDAHECLPELTRSFANSPLYLSLASIEAAYIRDASHVITVSPQIAARLKTFHGLRSSPVVVANGPTRVRDATAPSLREVVGLAPEVPLAVYSGWVAPERGLDTVLRAMQSMPDLHLALVVNSQSKELVAVFKLAHTLGVLNRVHAAPYVVPSQITQYLSSADIGLIPRKSGEHLDLSLPTKFREYAHAGLPMVVSDNAAMAAEINRTKIGRVFKAGNVGGLVLQIDRVLASPHRYEKRIVQDLLDEYSWETQASRLRPHYARVKRATDPIEPDFVSRTFSSIVRRTVPESTATSTLQDTEVWRQARASRYRIKLGIGRANHAGQAAAWASAVASYVSVPAQSFAPQRAIWPSPDLAVRRTLSVQQGALELGRIATEYTYLLIDGFESLFGPLMQGNLEQEIEVLRPHLFGIGLVAHGRDVRDPDLHAATVEGSYFARADEGWVDGHRDTATRNRDIANRFDGPVFVATPDLIQDLPGAHWLPVVVDPSNWGGLPAPLFGPKLRVLHKPSRSEPPIKGTDVIDPVLKKLDAEGVIDYISTDNVVDSEAIPALVARCDVVVDQIRTGSYGVAAVEAMTAGRVVVGSLTQTVRDEIGEDVPIIDAPPSEFENVIRWLAQTDREKLASIGSAGQEYAFRWHDGRRSARIIAERLLHSTIEINQESGSLA